MTLVFFNPLNPSWITTSRILKSTEVRFLIVCSNFDHFLVDQPAAANSMHLQSTQTRHLQDLYSNPSSKSGRNSVVELFCGKSERLKLVGCFRRGAPSLMFDEDLNSNLFEGKISSTACVYTRESWAPPASCFSWVVLYLMLSDNFWSVFFL